MCACECLGVCLLVNIGAVLEGWGSRLFISLFFLFSHFSTFFCNFSAFGQLGDEEGDGRDSRDIVYTGGRGEKLCNSKRK